MGTQTALHIMQVVDSKVVKSKINELRVCDFSIVNIYAVSLDSKFKATVRIVGVH